MTHYGAPAELIFEEEELRAAWNGQVRICDIWGTPRAAGRDGMPSLLGTDFLRHVTAWFTPRENLLVMELRPEPGKLVLEHRTPQ